MKTSAFHFSALVSSLALGSVLCVPALAEAATLVPPAQATRISQENTEVLEQLFVDAYSVKAQEKILVTRSAENQSPPEDPVAEAARVKADHYVALSFAELNGALQIRATLHRADGSVVHSAKATAPSMAEAPDVIERLAEELDAKRGEDEVGAAAPTSEEPSSEAQPIALTPTSEEPAQPKGFRRSAGDGLEKILGLKLGTFFVWADGRDFSPLMTIGFNGRFEMPWYFIEVGGGFGFPLTRTDSTSVDMGGLYTEFAANVYLTQTEVAPYLGAGMSPRIWYASGNGGAHIAAFAQVGLMFLRSSSTRVFFDFRSTVNLSEATDSGRGYHPLENGLEFGIGW